MPSTAAATAIRGKVKWFTPPWGFITKPDGSDIFVHKSNVMSPPDQDGVILLEGDTVEFTVGVGRDGKPTAKDVRKVAAA